MPRRTTELHFAELTFPTLIRPVPRRSTSPSCPILVVWLCYAKRRGILSIYSTNFLSIDLLGFSSLSSASHCQHQIPLRCLCISHRAPTRTREASILYVLHLLLCLLVFIFLLPVVALEDGFDRDSTFPHRTKRYPRNSPTRAGSCDVAPLFEPFALEPVHLVR